MNPTHFFRWLTYCISCMLVTVSVANGQAPTHTGKFAPVLNGNINGFYEYLPRNYTVDVNTRYPLLVFFHAAGENGTGTDVGVLDKITTWGVPKLIKTGAFPDSFYAAGQWHKFIVISPQVKEGVNWTVVGNPAPAQAVEAIIEYAKTAYRVDPAKIYLCGMSMGGSIAWSYAGSNIAAANKLAGIAVACGAGDLATPGANIIAAANLPVMATHNRGDMVVAYERTIDNAALISAHIPRITPQPEVVTWEGGDHNVWSRTFEDIHPGQTSGGLQGNLRDTLGLNVYEWLLQFSRLDVVLPVRWQSFDVTEINGVARLRWVVSEAVNTKSYTIERSNESNSWYVVGVVPARDSAGAQQQYQFTDQPNAACFYRIRLVDTDGKTSYSTVQKFVPVQQARPVNMYPNPFTDRLTIGLAGLVQKNIVIKIVNAGGQVVWRGHHANEGGNNSITIASAAQINRGVYYVIINDEEGVVISQTRVLKN